MRETRDLANNNCKDFLGEVLGILDRDAVTAKPAVD
jgi:hypothetical protein